MFNKKSQAALEFIMTYGWAILVVLVAIGALAYFGVLSPDRFLPAKCTLQSGIACLDHKVLLPVSSGCLAEYGVPATCANGRVIVVLKNSLGFDISGVVAKAGGCGDTSTNTPPFNSVSMANGGQQTFDINCGAASIITTSTTKYNQQVNITYTITDTGIPHSNQGQITARTE